MNHPATTTAGVILLGMLVAFAPAAIDLYLPSLPEIGRVLDASEKQVQLTLTAFLLGMCGAILIAGPLSDVLGRRLPLICGILLFVAASLLCAFAINIEQLIALRFLQAAGGGVASVLARVTVRDVFPANEAARVLSLMALVTSIAPLVAPLIGGQILRIGDWTHIFFALAAFGLICLLATWKILPESLPPERRSQSGTARAFLAYGHILADRVSLGYLLCGGFVFAAMFAYITGTPFVYIEYFKVPPEWYGVLFGLNIISQIIFTYINSRLVKKVGAERMSLYGTLAAFAGCAGLLVAGVTGWYSLAYIVICLLPIVGMTVMLGANAIAIMMHRFPENAGAAASTFTAGMFGFGAVASFFVGLLNNGTPWAMCMVIFGCGAISIFGRLILAKDAGQAAAT